MEPLPSSIKGPVAIIGDLHGQLEQLEQLLDQLYALPDFSRRWLVFLGDYVDRGPDSYGVIETILQLQKEHRKVAAICGNHDLAMASALGIVPQTDDSRWAEDWLKFYDAKETFESYQANFPDLDDLYDAVPAEHQEFLANLPWCVEHPRLFFVHAGLDPNTPFELQKRVLNEKDYSLHRPPWLCSKTFVDEEVPADCPLTVVSGHVPVTQVEFSKNKILADTTGGRAGELSCVLMPEKKVLQSGNQTDQKPWWKVW